MCKLPCQGWLSPDSSFVVKVDAEIALHRPSAKPFLIALLSHSASNFLY